MFIGDGVRLIRNAAKWLLAAAVAFGMTATPMAAQAQAAEGKSAHKRRIGSPYVELDSWVYPALDRLAALGYIHMDFGDTRPWTRVECARMTEEAGNALDNDPPVPPQAEQLYEALKKEFELELNVLAGGEDSASVRLESMYSDVMGISGPALNDSYHFGQTIINDYGRPYHKGFNSYDGFSGYATAGRFTIYTRGEFQHAPSGLPFGLAAREAIAAADGNPPLPATASPGVDQFRLLDTYAAMNLAGWDLAFGKQSLWWAPNEGGALLLSDNAEPIYMGRISRVAPFELPWIFRWLGPMKWDLFMGKLSGNEYPPRPLIHGEKISFKPTENLELSFSRTGEFGGVGRALTLGALLHTYTSFQSSVGYSASQNPGERNGGFDFSYRVPGLRNWLTIYGDFMSRDDPSPLDAPRRASWNPGLYLTSIPYVRRLDLRVEAVNTNTISSPARNGQFVYWEVFYRDLYTNKNNIIGDWIGREGLGVQAWSTYWVTPRNTIQFGYRHATVAPQFIQYGETLNDGSVAVNWLVRDDLQLSAFVQYEKWLAPILAPTAKRNLTSSVELTFQPRSWQR